jgi:hypothetical protein
MQGTASSRNALAFLIGCLSTCSLLISGCSNQQSNAVKAPRHYINIASPPKTESLIGTYIGYAEDDLTFYRLDLRPDSTGYFAQTAAPNTVSKQDGVFAYRITSWKTNDWDLIVELSPLAGKHEAEPLNLKGQLTGYGVLNMNVGGTNGNWNQNIKLQSEDRLMIPNMETKNAIHEIEKRK